MKQLTFSLKLTTYAFLLHIAIMAKAEPVYADTVTDCSTDLTIENERYTLSGDVNGDCTVTANGVIIDGLGEYSINGDVIARYDGLNSGPGYDVTLENLTINGAINARGDDGEDGGSITIIDSTVVLGGYDRIDARGGGGDYSYSSGGDGGTITITDSEISGGGYSAEITASGASADGYNGWNNGYMGGDGGSIIVTNSIIEDIWVVADGGDGDNGGLGGTVTVASSTVYGIAVNGGNAYGDAGIGGHGGEITITDSSAEDAYAAGGDGDTGGNGGTITITDSFIDEDVAANGGGDGNLGGNGGNITISNSTIGDSVEAGGHYALNGGNGGTIIFEYSEAYGIYAGGGYGDASGGDGGSVTFKESILDYDPKYGEGIVARGSAGGEDGTLTLINVGPTLEIDPEEDTADSGEDYDLLSGVSAEDFVDGDLLEEIMVTGTVGEEAGEYELLYSVTDNGLLVVFNGEEVTDDAISAEGSRIVTRTGGEEEEVEENTRSRSSSGGRAGGVSAPSSNNNSTLINQIIDEIKRRVQLMINNGETVNPAILSFLGTNQSQDLDLEYGDQGENVIKLQTLLINNGYSIPAGATGSFLEQTRTALTAFQTANSISPATGYFGPATGAVMKTLNWTGLWW